MSTIIESIERRQLKRVPRFEPGDRVRVHFQVVEGTRRRTQVFEGVVIARRGSGARETFTVRKQSFGVGVERTFPVHSPKIGRLEVVARGDVRRAKLYYLRGRIGKRARVAERRWGIEDELVGVAQEAEAIDSEGVTQADAAPETIPAEDEEAEEPSEAGAEGETEGPQGPSAEGETEGPQGPSAEGETEERQGPDAEEAEAAEPASESSDEEQSEKPAEQAEGSGEEPSAP